MSGRMAFRAGSTSRILAPVELGRGYQADRPAFSWLVEREVLRFLKIWHFTIAGPVISGLLFVVVFGFALAGRVSGVPGVPYAQFILPGLAAQAMLTVGYINGTTSLFEARHYRYVNDVLASPLRWWEVNAALVTGGVVRQVLTGAGILLAGVPLTGIGFRRPAGGWPAS
jgi:ABC-2 type transport system permease protein